jgi:hypothetical protein
MRVAMVERALSAWETQGLVKFDITAIPTEELWPSIDLRGAQRILALCVARPDDEGTEDCLSGLLGNLARLGVDPAALVSHLPAIRTPCLRIRALADLSPGLSPGELGTQIRAVIAAIMSDKDRGHVDLLDVLPLLPGVGANDRLAVLDELERLLSAEVDMIRGAEWETLFDRLAGLGEGARAERWVSLAGTCDTAVEGHLSLAARLPVDDPRRADLVRWAEEISERLDPKEQRWLHADLQGREALISEGWACRMMHRALSEARMCIRDLIPWMPVARRALGDERLARFVSFLTARPRRGELPATR